ncbi:MAG: LPP20 family lipoprotein, partial [Bacteroidota bacterium]
TWVSNKPGGGMKYVGIGMADKFRSVNYIEEAKKNALYDLASEIKVEISSNSVLHTMSDNQNYDQNFNSLIKLTNSESLEGYVQKGTYENEKQYWIYYELDKAEHNRLKLKKKQNCIQRAEELINFSISDEKNKNYLASIKKRIQAFEVLSPYLNEDIEFQQTQTHGVESIFKLTSLIQDQFQSVNLIAPTVIPVIKPYQKSYNLPAFQVKFKDENALSDFPFNVSAEEDFIYLSPNATSNNDGLLSVKILDVEPTFNKITSLIISPDLKKISGGDSLSSRSVTILRSLIQIPNLRIDLTIEPVVLFIQTNEINFGSNNTSRIVDQIIHEKFNSSIFKITDERKDFDYEILTTAETKADISNDLFYKKFKLNLAQLTLNITLKNKIGDVLGKYTENEIYGYAGNLNESGENAFNSNALKFKMTELLLLIKRQVINY